MSHKIRDMFLLICSGLVLVSLPIFLTHLSPIHVDLSQGTQKDTAESEEAAASRQTPQSKAAALKAKLQKISSCEIDEDCVIVDKDPCGCFAGPSGVTAINALHTLEFDKMQSHAITKACPEIQSTEQECSDTARAVCRDNTCKIIY